MLKNRILEKVLAIILIFTLTSVNFAFVTKSYASSFTDVLFGEKSDTGSKNVRFEAYFEAEDENVTSVVSDVNNEDIAISIDLSIENTGYLKDAEISIGEAEENSGLNFKLGEIEELPEFIQNLEDNVLRLKQVDSTNENISFKIPIEYKNEKYFDESNLSKDFVVSLKGTYIDGKGNEKEISKDVTLNISWKDERELKVESQIEKYIDYGEGIIVQSKVLVDSYTDANTLPVKGTEITINPPRLMDKLPDNIYVTANSTMGTNGDNVGEVEFTEENWDYNEEENKLTIKVDNEKQKVIVNEFEDEFLQNSEKELVEEERYYNLPGSDEFLITYTYNDVENAEESINMDSNVEAKVTLLSGSKEDNNEEVITSSDNSENLVLEDNKGEIVSLNVENETDNISKAYFYSNIDSEKYEIELNSKTVVNISNEEIVEGLEIEDGENLYVVNSENTYNNSDIYYREISISKDNFDEMLGENGEIKIYDLNENRLAVINSGNEVDENGNIVVKFGEKYSRLKFQVSSPIKAGNLIISNKKAIKSVSLDKQTMTSIDYIMSKASIKAEYKFVENDVEIKEVENKFNLLNTQTEVSLALIEKDSLSTLSLNEDVELRIELNNASDKSDLYGHSEFEIELPDSIEDIKVKKADVIHGENLSISSAEVEGKTIRVVLDIKQTSINSVEIENGTFISIKADLKVNVFTPSKTEVIKLRANNSEATNYFNNGEAEITVSYSAPMGLIVANNTYNYNDKGSSITSVNQGEKVDLLDVYSSAKIATMEIVAMNNYSNNVSDFSILGRFPFEGVKDIKNGDNLGTTITPRITKSILSDLNNIAEFNIYYSENAEATKDLNDENNGWKDSLELVQNPKSYLIMPADENYIMESGSVLKFSYEYEIPENLTHNENIYSTFIAYYTNLVNAQKEDSVPDFVGLTTGAGPEVKLEMITEKTEVREFGELPITLSLSNVGEYRAEDINVEFPIPEYTKYLDVRNDNEKIVLSEENNVIKAHADELEANEKIEFTVLLTVNELPDDEVQNEYNIEPKATVTAKDLGATLTAESDKIRVLEAEFEITISNNGFKKNSRTVLKAGDTFEYSISIRNLTQNDIGNIIVTQKLPEELTFIKATITDMPESDAEISIEDVPTWNSEVDIEDINEIETAQYDAEGRIITWKIDSIKGTSGKNLLVYVEVNELKEGVTKANVYLSAEAVADGTDRYESNEDLVQIGRPLLKITQTASNVETYIKEGDSLKYTFSVINEGGAVATGLKFTDIIPDGVSVSSLNYSLRGTTTPMTVSTSEYPSVTVDVFPEDELVINVDTIVSSLGAVQEKTISNYGTLEIDNKEPIESETITHIVEPSDSNTEELESSTSNVERANNGSSTNNSSITKTYKVSGQAWIDSNRDGMRNEKEEALSGVSAMLVNSDTGVINSKVTTDYRGAYTFSGIENGNYIVIFDYDTLKYSITAYKKAGVASNVNSDFVATKVEQEGKVRNAAISDIITISNGSVSGIDLGLFLAETFDLKIDKSITKVTVQAPNGTNTDSYDKAKFAKAEIAAKNLVGATVTVEYNITVTNNGDIAGYAKKIVDYIPNGMTFNSTLGDNAKWYTGSNGDLYTEALANKELASGESATVRLILTRQMTEDNTGIVSNLAEIHEDYNLYGVSDINSKTANKAQGENDLSSADIAIMIKTGETFINISIIMMTLLLLVIVAFVVYGKVLEIKKRKGGV